jgi:hypothetical protein
MHICKQANNKLEKNIMYFIMKTLALVVQRYPFAYILYILHAKMMTFESEKSSVEMFTTVYMIKKI